MASSAQRIRMNASHGSGERWPFLQPEGGDHQIEQIECGVGYGEVGLGVVFLVLPPAQFNPENSVRGTQPHIG